MTSPSASIPTGSWVLVTGANGYLAAQVVKHFLERDYKVRGTVRDVAKASWLVDDVFKSYADRGDFALVVVEDFAASHAFDDAVKGVSAVIHVASIMTFDPDAQNVIPYALAGTTGILEAALSEPSVKEFVYTSSIAATTMPFPGNPTHVGKDTFNDMAVTAAWAPPPWEPHQGFLVYWASKVESEKAVWRFVDEKKPNFTVNVVVPAMIIGEQLDISHVNANPCFPKHALDNNVAVFANIPGMYTVDVKDAAMLHVAAALDPEAKNTRLQAWADNCTYNNVLEIMREFYPERKLPDDLPGMSRLSITTDTSEPLGLLEKWTGQSNWKSLEQSVIESVQSVDILQAKAQKK
ncbi:Aldehyde reductase 2 [Cladobotryum mycophilum]|uniref:Aldehyde reductase 2 n=1 Tax=Cladobotryum mycophilum TaxID=491253 RepID=A0ABR0SHC9_9HYPO